MSDTTYCVSRYRNGSGSRTTIAERISTLEEAAAVALRLTRLQEEELGGTDEFTASPE